MTEIPPKTLGTYITILMLLFYRIGGTAIECLATKKVRSMSTTYYQLSQDMKINYIII